MFGFLKKKYPNKLREPLTRKQLLIRVGIGLVVLIFAAAGAVAALRYRSDGQFRVSAPDETASTGPEITEAAPPIPTVVSPLDGREVTAEVAARRPLGIMIENHPDARPQWGLSRASIVYEAVTEGGITRFLAIFGTHDLVKIGPVRSARPYYLGWALEHDAGYAHVGGSDATLAKIKELHVKDLDEFALGTRAFWREPTKGKATEHTMFTDTSKLRTIVNDKFGSDVNRPNLKFKEPLAREHRGTSQQITVGFSITTYNPTWTFDPETNRYLRAHNGSFHKDATTGETVAANTLIIQLVRRTGVESMETVGEGTAEIFRDGKRIEAKWKKEKIGAPTVFSDATGAEIARNPGLTWIAIVDPSMKVGVSE